MPSLQAPDNDAGVPISENCQQASSINLQRVINLMKHIQRLAIRMVKGISTRLRVLFFFKLTVYSRIPCWNTCLMLKLNDNFDVFRSWDVH